MNKILISSAIFTGIKNPLGELLPSKGWETTQQDVGDDSSCPDVHLKAIPAHRPIYITTKIHQR